MAYVRGNSIAVALNQGGGVLVEQPPFTLSAIATGASRLVDVNGDGHLDLMVGSTTATSLLTGDGRGRFLSGWTTFRPSSTVSQPSPPPAMVDFDGDGDVDALFGGYIELNDGTGVFSERFFDVPLGQPLVGRFNGTGLLDVVTVQPTYYSVVRGVCQ